MQLKYANYDCFHAKTNVPKNVRSNLLEAYDALYYHESSFGFDIEFLERVLNAHVMLEDQHHLTNHLLHFLHLL